MYSGIVVKPYWGFKVGDRIYLYRSKDLSSFVVTVWDIDEFRECVKLDRLTDEEQCEHEFAHQEQPNEDYFEGVNDYLNGTMGI